MITDISEISPEVLEQIKQALAASGGLELTHRTPVTRKPLTDLRTPRNPQNRLHRPTFFPVDEAADSEDRPLRVMWYPKLKFKLDSAGRLVETCVLNEVSEKALGPEWVDTPPLTTPLTRDERIAQELAQLSDADRELVLKAQRDLRMNRLQQALSELPDADLARLTASSAPTPKASKKT